MADVFISHVEEDADLALELALALAQAGYSSWCYELDSLPGVSYLIQTGRAIDGAKAVVLVISPHSVASRQVTRELVRAHESGRDFIPVLRDMSHVEFQERQPEWREALGAAASVRIPPQGLGEVLPRILDGLRALGLRSGPSLPPERLASIRAALEEVKRGGRVAPAAPPRVEPEEPQGREPDVPPPPRPPSPARGPSLAWAAAAVLAVMAVAGVGYFFRARKAPPPPGPVVVGVMEIHARGEVPEWMRDFTRDGLNTVLSKIDGVRVFSKQKIDFVREKRGLTELEAAEALGISKMVSGSLSVVNANLSLYLQVVDIGSGMLEDSEQASGAQDQLIELQNQVAVSMVRAMHVQIDPDEVRKIFAARTNDALDSYKLLTETLGGGDAEEKPHEAPKPPKPAASWSPWVAVARAESPSPEEAAVRTLLEQYRSALEAKNLDKLAAVSVNLTDSQRDAFQRYFQAANDLKIQFSNVDILIEGNEALATFTREDVFKDVRSGREMHLEVRMSTELAKQDQGWRIRAIKKPS